MTAKATDETFLFESTRMSPRDAKRIGVMWGRFGKRDDRRCKDCDWFVRECHGASTYSKCQRFGVTNGPATDWNGRFVACGEFKQCGDK